ncbi:MAG: tripartite tricarboxylate transporter permease [Propionibacteriaceae bacterium]|nr:tripartite tricarboxylate transporter permease [Propionibacteriaceae bacterium]
MNFEQLLDGLAYGFQPDSLLVIVLGVLVGWLVGAAPGLGPPVGMSLMLPLALTISAEDAVLLLVSVFIAASYAGSVPGILLKIPGTTSSMMAAIEGYPMHQRKEGGRAMAISLVSSIFGQLVSITIFILAVIPLSQFAVRLLFPEMFVIVLVGLVSGAALVGNDVIKGIVATAIGLLFSCVGTDPNTGTDRFTFGIAELHSGIDMLPVIIGLLAFREVFAAANVSTWVKPVRQKLRVMLTKSDLREIAGPSVLGAGVGTFIGAVPGAGGSIAAFLTYGFIGRGRRRSEFGKGSRGALAGIESANNAAIGGELIPTFGLGVPGAPAMVVIMAALTAQGLVPGPKLFESRPQLLYATFGGMITATLVLAVIGFILIKPAIYVTSVSPAVVLTATAALVVVGVYALRWQMFDVLIAFIAGLVGYLLDKQKYPVALVALAYVLGPIMEANLRRGLIMTDGLVGFFTRPIVIGGLVLAIFLLFWDQIKTLATSTARKHGSGKEKEPAT